MSYKELIKGKSIRICDICNNEIKLESKDRLSLTIEQSWYSLFGYKNIEICIKHKKEVLKFIKKLKKQNKEENLK